MRKKILAGLAFCVFCVSLSTYAFADTLTMQDFEDGTLAGWTAGGRQTGGSTNLRGVSEYAGSQMAYLYHRGFSELTLSKSFSYIPDMILSFDAEFSIDGDTSPAPNGNSEWDSYNVWYSINFNDVDGNRLGGTPRYVAETTSWWTDALPNATLFHPDGLQHYEYDVTSLASALSIDSNAIDTITLGFGGYSPIGPYEWRGHGYQDWHTMVVRFDNVGTSSPAPVPEPASILLLGTGLIGLAGTRIRRKKK